MKIKGAIFDIDGTLIDSMYMWETIGSKYVSSKGFSATEEDQRIMNKSSVTDSMNYIKNRFNLPLSVEEIYEEITDMMLEIYLSEVEPKEGAKELLEYLKAKGVKMCAATGSERKLIEKVLPKLGLDGYFEEIFYSDEVGLGKYDTKIFQLCMDVLGTEKEDTMMFEDALYSAKTVNKFGIKLCGVYDKSEPFPEEMKRLSDIYVNSPYEALKYLKNND